MSSTVEHFSYDSQDRVVAEAIKREKEKDGGNFSAYIRRAIEYYEGRPSIEDRLVAIERILKEGIVPVMPDRLEDDKQDQMFDNLLSSI